MSKGLSVIAAAAFSIALSAFSYADDAHHPDEQKGAATQPAPKQRATEPSRATTPKDVKRPSAEAGMPPGMMENMGRMQKEMQQLAQTQDPKERDALLQTHLKTMREHMAMIRDMTGGAGGTNDANAMSMDKCMQMMHDKSDKH